MKKEETSLESCFKGMVFWHNYFKQIEEFAKKFGTPKNKVMEKITKELI